MNVRLVNAVQWIDMVEKEFVFLGNLQTLVKYLDIDVEDGSSRVI